jgi:hypothetical protein
MRTMTTGLAGHRARHVVPVVAEIGAGHVTRDRGEHHRRYAGAGSFHTKAREWSLLALLAHGSPEAHSLVSSSGN